jgi:hypothetical protein
MDKPRLQGHKAEKALSDPEALNYLPKHPTGSEMTDTLDERGFLNAGNLEKD